MELPGLIIVVFLGLLNGLPSSAEDEPLANKTSHFVVEFSSTTDGLLKMLTLGLPRFGFSYPPLQHNPLRAHLLQTGPVLSHLVLALRQGSQLYGSLISCSRSGKFKRSPLVII